MGVPAGYYWLDLDTGAYGYVGGPLLGFVGGGQTSGPGYNRTTIGGGSLMSDGQSSLIEGMPAGNCYRNLSGRSLVVGLMAES